MWMECQDDEPMAAPAQELRAWLHTETFEFLAEVNEKCLELLTEQALMRSPHAHPMLRELVDLWRSLDSSARRRAAGCPYLILDAGFADPRRWRSLSRLEVQERERPHYSAFFTVALAPRRWRRVASVSGVPTQHHTFRSGVPAKHCSIRTLCFG